MGKVVQKGDGAMTEQVLAAVRTGAHKTELREYPMPEIPEDGALLKMEAAGICGTDVKLYGKPPSDAPVIMGHENIGTIVKARRQFAERKGVKEGDLVFVEHYVPCFQCEWCHQGEYRLCAATDWRRNPDAIRYGYTSAARAPHLWGGFAHYMFLPWNAVLHKVPAGVTPERASVVTPMANGIQWALLDCNVGYNDAVLIQGPGQQGLSQTVACKQAGASLIIVTGTQQGRGPARGRARSSAPTMSSTSTRKTRWSGSWRSPAGAASTWHSTARRARGRRRSCSASTRSSARAAPCWCRARSRPSRTSRSPS